MEEKYDVILVDAYQDITIPFQMSSVEFFRLVKEHLNPGGVMVVNMNMRTGDEKGINGYLQDTIASVFPWVTTVDVPRYTNRELFAADAAPDTAAFRKALEELSAPLEGDDRRELTGFLTAVWDRLTDYEPGGRLLTDDRAPVELLGMRAIDVLIADELAYYRAQGPGALLDLLG